MTTKEAMEALLEGKKIRKPSWDKNEYIHISEHGRIVGRHGGIISLDGHYKDYMLYEEQKQTVVIEKWLCYDNLAESYSICEESNIDGFINDDRAYLSKVKLLYTYEIPL